MAVRVENDCMVFIGRHMVMEPFQMKINVVLSGLQALFGASKATI